MRKISISLFTLFFLTWSMFLPIASAWNPGVWKPAELQNHEWKVDPLQQ